MTNTKRNDVSERNVQSGKQDWYAYDRQTGELITDECGGPYATKAQCLNENFHRKVTAKRGRLVTYELFMRTHTEDKPVAEFTAANDAEAFDKAQDVYDALPSRNISVPYMVREKGTSRVVDPS
jgi:hypothetical protein